MRTIRKYAVMGVFVATGMLSSHATFAKEVAPPASLVPNLTVNFTLNSALGPTETEYYVDVVKNLLSNIPTELVLSGRSQNLLLNDKSLDHIKVITYLPSFNDDDTKDIRYFKVVLRLPSGAEEQQIAAVKGLKFDDMKQIKPGQDDTPIDKGTISGKIFADNSVIEKAKPPVTQKPEIITPLKPVETAQVDETPAPVVEPQTKPEITPEQPIAVAQAEIPAEPVIEEAIREITQPTKEPVPILAEKEPQPEEKVPAKVKPVPVPKVVAEKIDKPPISPKKAIQKKRTKKAKTVTKRKKTTRLAKVAPKKEIIPKRKKGESIRVSFIADESMLFGKKRKDILSFLKKYRGSKNKKLRVMTTATQGPLEGMSQMGQERLRYIKAFMREQGIDPANTQFSEVHVNANEQQFVELELVSNGKTELFRG